MNESAKSLCYHITYSTYSAFFSPQVGRNGPQGWS